MNLPTRTTAAALILAAAPAFAAPTPAAAHLTRETAHAFVLWKDSGDGGVGEVAAAFHHTDYVGHAGHAHREAFQPTRVRLSIEREGGQCWVYHGIDWTAVFYETKGKDETKRSFKKTGHIPCDETADSINLRNQIRLREWRGARMAVYVEVRWGLAIPDQEFTMRGTIR